MSSSWYAGRVAGMLFGTHFELDAALYSVHGLHTGGLPRMGPTVCSLTWGKDSYVTCRPVGLTTAMGGWSSAPRRVRPGTLGLFAPLLGNQEPRRRESEPPSHPHQLSALTSEADSQLACVGSKQELFPFSFIFITNCGPQTGEATETVSILTLQ